MPKRALRCVVDLKLHAVSAPGVWLPSKEEVYLSVSMLGQYKNTHLMPSIFPLLINEKFRFEKTFYTAMDPSDVADYMEDELVIFELIQLSEYCDGGVRMATFSTNLRDFLYPYPSLAPTYTSTCRELLMCRTVAFPGIAPKLEFSTSTVIKESYSPELDALDDALEEERRLRRLRTKRSTSPKRARSPSLSLHKRFDDIDLTDTTRPPFVVRKLDSDLIGRVPGGPVEKNAKKKKKRSYSLSRSTSRSSLAYGTCDGTSYIDRNCLVCQAYKRHMGRPYWGHTYNYHPTGHYYNVPVYRDSYDDPLPVYRSKYLLDDDDDDAEVAELTSARHRCTDITPVRPRSVSPLLYRSSFRSRFDRPYSPCIPSTSLVRKHRSIERLDRLSPVDVTPFLPKRSAFSSYLCDSLDDLERETLLAKSRRYLW